MLSVDMKAAGASEASLQEAAQERDELTGRLNQLEAELGELRPLYEAQVADNAQLSR